MIRCTFTAELHCQFGQIGVVDTPLGAHPFFSADQDGWLSSDDKRGDSLSFKPVKFRFTFLEERKNRLHYRINCASDLKWSGARLEQNNNGWLGLYGGLSEDFTTIIFPPSAVARIPALQDIWKLETLQAWDGNLLSAEDIEFYLRDEKGHRVAQVEARYSRSKPALRHWFLHAGDKEGDILRFHLHGINVS